MSTIQKGDKVRFLNSTGGGEVTRVQRDGIVYVRDESGFEIPVLQHEVVVISEGSGVVPQPRSGQSITSALQGDRTSSPASSTKERSTSTGTHVVTFPQRTRPTDPSGEQLDAYLCYLPEDPDQLGQTPLEVYLVNDSNYDLQVLYMSGQGERRTLRFQGVVPFDCSELLEVFSPALLSERLHTTLVIVPFKAEGDYAPKAPHQIELRVEGNRFFRTNAFKPNDFFDDGAIIFDLIRADKGGSTVTTTSLDHLAEQMMSPKEPPMPIRSQDREGTPRSSRLNRSEPVVVDLHIHELVDTTAGMSNKDMLDLQLAEVERVMNGHRRERGREIIFIHGKGEGVLRKAVRDLITRKYPKADQQDASFVEYGFGATKVIIR